MKPLLHFFLSFVMLIPAVHSQCMKDQQLSLLQFKKSLVFHDYYSDHPIDPLTKLVSWNASSDCCSWDEITCSRDGRVLGLDLSSQQISAGIDNSSSLFHLHSLQSLNLADNYNLGYYSQPIPSAFGNLLNLRYLNLSGTSYSGKIPIEISRLTKLVVLDLSYIGVFKLGSPNLHMFIYNLTELRELYLDDVHISEQGSEWCRAISSSLPNLRVLSMSDCDLSGALLPSLANLRSLSVINLEGNNISAPVPKFFANFSNLTVLSLAYSELHGTFPKEIFQLPSLQSIHLSFNDRLDGSLPEFPRNGSLQHLDLSGTKFSASLPNSIGNLKFLSTLEIGYCNFSGSIPKSMANLTQLVSLSMYANNLEGSLPSFSGAKDINDIDLSDNGLTGTINSTHWSNLTKLTYLSLRYNKLDGNIPASLFSLPLLHSLDLSHNQFAGPFPEISNMSSCLVNDLDLSWNNLEGSIPGSIFSLQGLIKLDLSSNDLSGPFPLNALHQLRNLTYLDLSHNNLFLSRDYTNFSYSSFPQFDSIILASLNLKTIPNFLRNQSNLGSLDLSENQISGKIPNWIQSLSDLGYLNLSCNSLDSFEFSSFNLTILRYIDLHSNQLHGRVPIFPPSHSIEYLDFSRNHFNSIIPSTIGNALSQSPSTSSVFLSLSSNNLSGIIPKSLCDSQSLKVLDLSNNSLSGTVPRCLTTMESLTVLNLRRNNLTKVNQFSKGCSLTTLDMSTNRIRGRFLKSLVHCPELEVLNLGSNMITEPFPCFLRKTSSLRVLVLRSNKFYGSIGCHHKNGTWPLLQIMDLAHNNFIGEVPATALTTLHAMRTNKYNALAKTDKLDFRNIGSYYQEETITVTNKGREIELVNVLTIFTSVDFSCNKFNGSIPNEIGELVSLYALNLSNNAFTGAIPSSLSNVGELESLDLSKNILSGRIPPELAKLTFLAYLNLSCNQLAGRIPSGNQFSTFGAASFEGNTGLWGPPLTGFSSPKPEGNHPSNADEIDWDIICPEIGFACGFGIAIGSLLFCKRWRKWYYTAVYNILLKVFPQLEQRFGHHRRHVHIHQRHWRS